MNSQRIIYFCVFLLSGFFMLNAQVNLGYNLQKGDQFKVFQKAKQDISQNMNGTEHDITNILEATYTFKVEEDLDSLYTIDFKFDSFKMVSTSSIMGELISINTKDSIAEDDIEAKLFSGLTKTFLTMKMYKNGKVKEVTGSKSLIDNMVSSAGDFDDFTKEMMKAAMEKEFGDSSLGESFEQMTYIYPNKPVNVNDTWENSFKGDLNASNVWTLIGVSKELIELNAKSDIIFKSEEDSVTMDLSGTMDTEVKVDPSTGFIKSMHNLSTAKGISILKQMSGVEVPTTIVSDVTYKVERNVQ
ncbi:DUF6263 family protein [Winogradskyella sp. 3972H.M.0a.05]|uniref:DUF6263 family protein n=1 Tax=Winogradskyella sp. 3972H.M.0a.05 TaxID=2950277 RepID=UPI0033993772